MADGTAKPIETVEPGDEVVVTDPETGRTEMDTVTATIHSGETMRHSGPARPFKVCNA